MKKYIFYYGKLVALFLFVNISQSQNNYQVKYKMTTLFDGLKDYDATLTFNDKKASFEYKLQIKDTASTQNYDINGNESINFPTTFLQSIFVNLRENKLQEIKLWKKKYLIDEILEMPKWNITNESKIIKNKQCQKASTFYKGRFYEVWYTIDYPTSFGPWKLNGLPGLIILGQDKKNEVYFEAIEIKNTPSSIPQPTGNYHQIARKEFEDIIKKWQKEFAEKAKSQGTRNSTITYKFSKAIDIEIPE